MLACRSSDGRLFHSFKPGLWQIAVLVCRLYAKAWTLAPEAAATPWHDQQLLKDLTAYMDVKRDVTKAALSKLQRHLWYLLEELIVLALFDPWSWWTRRGKCSPHATPSRRWISSEVPNTSQPSHLWTPWWHQMVDGINQYMTLLPEAGLARRLPRCWSRDLAGAGRLPDSGSLCAGDSDRQRSCGARSCCHASVLLKSNPGWPDEEQLQFLLQVVSRHRVLFPDSKKKTVAAGVTAQQQH